MQRTVTILGYLLAFVIAFCSLSLKAELTDAIGELGEMREQIADLQQTVEARQTIVIHQSKLVAHETPWNTIYNATITAYCPCVKCCDEWAGGLTFTGTTAAEGRTCAVDPATIPLGAEVEINGVVYIAEDTGVKGAAVDIFMSEHSAALAFGRQTATVRWRVPDV